MVVTAQPRGSPKDLPRCVLSPGTSIKVLTVAHRKRLWPYGHFPGYVISLHAGWNVRDVAASVFWRGEREHAWGRGAGKRVRSSSARAGVAAGRALFWRCLCAIVSSCHSEKRCYQRSWYSAACAVSTGSSSLLGREVPVWQSPRQSQGLLGSDIFDLLPPTVMNSEMDLNPLEWPVKNFLVK